MRAWERWLPEITLTVMVGIPSAFSLVIYYSGGIVVWALSVIWGIATLSAVLLPGIVRRSGEDWRKMLRLFLGLGLVLGVFSIFTGLGNNATDEPVGIVGYLNEYLHGQDPYTTLFSQTYTVHILNIWSNTVTTSSYYTYLPLAPFVQIPGTGVLGYELLCLGCWAGTVYILRNDQFAGLVLASPVVALLASNGFTDLPLIALMTLSLRGWTGPKAKAVEYLTYGMKQFANVFWVAYYILKKDLLQCGIVILLTVLIALPFVFWHPTGIWCEALTFSLGPGCTTAPNSMRQLSDLYSHWNYYLWILWVYALFHGWINTTVRSGIARLRGPVRAIGP